LIGHKHRQRYHPFTGKAVRLAAGAVNPARNEGDWEPGYNLIKLKVINIRDTNVLRIESHLRVWQTSPDRFVAKENDDGKDVFIEDVILRQRPSQVFESSPKETNESTREMSEITVGIITPVATVTELPEANEVPMESISMRDLVFKFWSLSPSQRRKTMQDMGLLEGDDDKLPETVRYRLAFDRARERGQIYNLKEAVDKLLSS
jgi:hypothetical protein